MITGLENAQSGMLEAAGETLYTKIDQYTADRKKTHERLKTLIRARILRNDKSKTGKNAEEDKKEFPVTDDEKNALMYVLGPFPTDENDIAVTSLEQYSECCS